MKTKPSARNNFFDVVNWAIKIGPLKESFDPNEFFNGMFTTNPWMGDVFEKDVLKEAKIITKSKTASLKSIDLKKSATDNEIFKTFMKIIPFKINDILWVIAKLMKTSELRKEERHANLFYIKKAKDFFVIHLLWWEEGIRIFCWRFGCHGPHWPALWPKGTRVFLPSN